MPLFITAPLAVAGIGAVLAALIAVLDSIVNNYGDVRIDINSGSKALTARGGPTLLRLLADGGIYLPSACGGRGACGVCKCRITSDVGPILPTETPYLTPADIDKQVRLACQVKVKQDIAIEVPGDVFSVRQCKGTVEAIEDMTYDIKRLRIRLDDPRTVEFVAGQYAQLVAPPYDEIKDYVQRAYSISSAPSDKAALELLVRLVPGGALTTYVFKYLKPRQKVELMAPFGDFGMRDTPAIKLGVAGGSGMAPLRSIILDMLEKGRTDTEFWYFFGARAVRDLYGVEEMREIERKWPRFHFVAALSEPLPEDGWQGEVGLITDVLGRYLETRIDRGAAREGYLCGSPGMIDACIKVMQEHGITDDRIYYDKFA
jgi:Na+-transporting NADH:ubiquinone oxidoreductase subunit F